MVDRSLAGYVAIIIVITSVLTGIVFQVKQEEAVTVLAKRMPENIPGGRPGTPSYSFDLMATREVPELVVRSYFLVNLTNPQLMRPWNETEGRTLHDLIENLPRTSGAKAFLDRLSALTGNISGYRFFEVEPKSGRRLLVFDFTDAMEALAGPQRLGSLYTIYAFEPRPSGNVTVYAGLRDFFFRREKVISEIRYSSPSGQACYRSKEAVALGECNQISDAPVGILKFKDLRPGDKVHVEVRLSTLHMFGHRGLLHIVTTQTGYGPGPVISEFIGSRAT